MALIKCFECGKEVSDKASSCPNCGYPIIKEQVPDKQDNSNSIEPNEVSINSSTKKNNAKRLIPIILIAAIIIMAMGVILNNKVIQPKKVEAENKLIYEEAVELLEKCEYVKSKELLQSIIGYKDSDVILNQIKEILNIVGDWNGVGVYINDKLTLIDKGLITATIKDDNTFEFKINDQQLSGVWAEIDSSKLESDELAYNFVTYEAEEVGQGILTSEGTLNNKDNPFSLSVAFGEENLWVQFEKNN